MMSEPKIGVSPALTGLQVDLHQDGHFAQDLLDSLHVSVNAVPVNSAFVIPLPTPRFAYTTASLPLQADNLNGLIIDNILNNSELHTNAAEDVSQKAPSVERDRLLDTTVQEKYAWLPLIESEQLRDPALRENFIICVTALHHLNSLRTQTLTRRALIDFHSRYKLVLLAHNQPGYRKIGSFVALIHQWKDLEEFFVVYRQNLMAILQQPASRENHVNVMMHIQGYFNRQMTAEQRSETCRIIHDYRLGKVPLNVPLAELKRYLSEYPNHYLMTQQYFNLYPNNLYLN